MGRTYLSKIPTISSNRYTIMLLLIVGEFGYPEVHSIRTSKPISIQIETSQSEEVTSSIIINNLAILGATVKITNFSIQIWILLKKWV